MSKDPSAAVTKQ